MNWKYLEGSGHVLVEVQLLHEGTRKSSVRMRGILSEIRNDHLPIKRVWSVPATPIRWVKLRESFGLGTEISSVWLAHRVLYLMMEAQSASECFQQKVGKRKMSKRQFDISYTLQYLKSLWRWYINTNIMFLDIIHRPAFI
jgi:hypothetical protein